MKKLILFTLILPFLAACQKQVPAGHVGVKVYLTGTSKGIDHEALGVGRYFIGYNEQLFLFPTFQQNYVWSASEKEGAEHDESIEFGAMGGVDVHANVGVAFHINPDKVADVFQKYREGVDEIRNIPLRNAVRDSFQVHGGKYNVEALYTEKGALVAQVQKDVKAQFDPMGIVVDSISLVGNFKLPDAVTQALNAKIGATQKAQQRENEVAEAKAQAEKDIAQATGLARANELKAKSITQPLIEWEKIQKWDGHMPQYIGGGNPMIQLKGVN